MELWALNQSLSIRIGIFLFLLIIFIIWEIVKPDHTLSVTRKERWISNLAVVFLNNIILRVIFPYSAILFSDMVIENKWGLLQIYEVRGFISIILGILILDFIIYLQHVVFHSIPLLWKLHRMHHADLELDVTSGTRFHPLEIIISMGIKFSAILLFGINPITVVIFEIILNGMAMFNHSNIYINPTVNKYLKYLFVTPSMHRIHHSIKISEYNTNYGFNLSLWDRLMGTYNENFKNKLILGLPNFRNHKYTKLHYMLIIPFIEETE
jgi:sterol desaturase/sphingolipid hydroxylase (fatty acid hydroxylase superfamily)